MKNNSLKSDGNWEDAENFNALLVNNGRTKPEWLGNLVALIIVLTGMFLFCSLIALVVIVFYLGVGKMIGK